MHQRNFRTYTCTLMAGLPKMVYQVLMTTMTTHLKELKISNSHVIQIGGVSKISVHYFHIFVMKKDMELRFADVLLAQMYFAFKFTHLLK